MYKNQSEIEETATEYLLRLNEGKLTLDDIDYLLERESDAIVNESFTEMFENVSSGYLCSILKKEFVSDPINFRFRLEGCFYKAKLILDEIDDYETKVNLTMLLYGLDNSEFDECMERAKYFTLNIKSLIINLKYFHPLFPIEYKLSALEKELQEEKLIDRRKSLKQPTNLEKIKALRELAPMFIKNLRDLNSSDQKKAIHLITGVNLEDSYKLTFGNRQSQIENIEILGLEQLKKMILK